MDNLMLAAMLVMIIGYMIWRNERPEPAREADATVTKRLSDLDFRVDGIDSNSIKSIDLDRKIAELNTRVENDRVSNNSQFMDLTNDIGKVHDHLEQVRKVAMSPRHISITDITSSKPLKFQLVAHDKAPPIPEPKPVEKIKPKKVSSR